MKSTAKYPAHDLTLFFAVTFMVSWGTWHAAIKVGGSAMTWPTVLLYILGALGPSVGALAVRVRRGRRPAPEYAVRSRGRRLVWVVPLLALGSSGVLAGVLATPLLGGAGVQLDPGLKMVALSGGPVAFLISSLIGGPLPEEPGWRGTAYPRLRAKMGRTSASLLLGVVWSVWHLPLFFIPGTVQAGFGLASWVGLFFFLSVVPMSVLTCVAYERAGVVGSIVTHLAVNATLALLTVNSAVAMACIVVALSVLALLLLAAPAPKPKPRHEVQYA
jgi:membrane protease YdiL (CAAX protease family)